MIKGADIEARWFAGNQAYLLCELARIKQRLTAFAAHKQGTLAETLAEADAALSAKLVEISGAMPAPSALETLCAAYSLSGFERDLLLLCVGCDFDTGFAELCQQIGGATQANFSLALAALPDPHWSALSPRAPLRRAHLINLGDGDSLIGKKLRVDEWVVHYLLGMAALDERLQTVLRSPAPPSQDLLPQSQQNVAERTRELLVESFERSEPLLIWLCGPDVQDQKRVAATACADLELDLYTLRSADLPPNIAERELLHALWEREVKLSGAALLLCCDESLPLEINRAALSWLDRLPGVVLCSSREVLSAEAGERRNLRLDVPRPSCDERLSMWQSALGDASAERSEVIEQVAVHFRLGCGGISAASTQAMASIEAGRTPADALWDACRQQSRPKLDELARRIEPQATWEDLILPPAQQKMLRELLLHQRHQATVYHRWAMGRGGRGLGVTALFVGQSGTGKTLAAEVLARELRLDMYHIDLSQIVSKYIGETEKNLRRVFDAAEEGGGVLLFDEADALFGKRTEVKDSHDRYANIEVSYLLQRMESYQGISVLTSNNKSALDSAFQRRIRFIIQFPFPDAQQRSELWRRALQAPVPTADLAFDRLARLSVTGGQIRNIALSAAFLAADEKQPVRMRHLLQATRGECAKNERPLTEAEIGGWV